MRILRNLDVLHRPLACILVLALGCCSGLAVPPAQAGRFMVVLESETLAPGRGEFVQAGDWCRHRSGGIDERRLGLQLGMELGVARALHLGLALPAFSATYGPDSRESGFGGTGVWGVYNILAPDAQAVGLSTAVLVSENDQDVTLETSVILERARGATVVALNLSVSRSWPRDPAEKKDDHISARFGVSHGVSRAFSVAIETEWRLLREDARRYRSEEFLIGPAVLWEGESAWLLGGLFIDLQPDSELRQAAFQAQIGVPF